jgi:hypothetical protein
METLVRRGHRSLHEYDGLLESLGYEEGARAAMVDLLQIQIDDDARAADARTAAAAKLAAKGLSLEQFRRAVILGITDISAFTPWLLAQGFTTPAAAVLLAELQFDRDEAVVAAARRQEADRRSQVGKAPLSDVRRAARLGLIPVGTYYARLRADGYTDDDVAIESDLLATEIAQDRAAQALAASRTAAPTDKGLTLGQLAAGVLAGAASLDSYIARALALGFTLEDAQVLAATLQDRIDATAAARARKADLMARGGDRELARADVEKAVRAGLRTLDEYGAWLAAQGYADDDAALLVEELQTALEAGGPGGPAEG